MSEFLFRLNLDKVLNNPPAVEEERFEALAELIARRLDAMVDTMQDRGYVFEAGETSDLARRFEKFAASLDTTSYPFSLLWVDLCDWANGLVQVGRKEKGLCNVPTLPSAFSC